MALTPQEQEDLTFLNTAAREGRLNDAGRQRRAQLQGQSGEPVISLNVAGGLGRPRVGPSPELQSAFLDRAIGFGEAGGRLAAGVPIGLAKTAGFPVDIAALATKGLFPVSGQLDPAAAPVGGSAFMVEQLGRLGLPTEPEGTLGLIGEEVGQTLVPAAAIAKVAKRIPALKSIAQRPLKFFTQEMLGAVGAGVGRGQAEAVAEATGLDPVIAETIGALGGGLTGTGDLTRIVGTVGRGTVGRVFRGRFPPVTAEGARREMRRLFKEAAIEPQDFDALAAKADEIFQRTGVAPTLGQVSGDPGLLALERELTKGPRGQALLRRLKAQESASQDSISRAIARLAIDPRNPNATIRDVARSIQRTVANAQESVASRVRRMRRGGLRQDKANAVVRDALEFEKEVVQGPLGDTFTALRNSGIQLDGSPIDAALDSIQAATTDIRGKVGPKLVLPDVVLALFARRNAKRAAQKAARGKLPVIFDASGQPFRRAAEPPVQLFKTAEDFETLKQFRTILREEGNRLTSEGKNSQARFIKQLQASIETVFDNPTSDNEDLINLWRETNKAWAQSVETYDTGIVAQFLAKTKKGVNKLSEFNLMAKAVISGEPGRGAAGALVKALNRNQVGRDALHDAVIANIAESITFTDGTASSTRAIKTWISRHAPFLDELQKGGIPIKRELNKLAKTQREVERFFGGGIRPPEEAEFAVARLFLNDDPERAVKRVLGSANSQQQMRGLVRLTAGDDIAKAGLRRATLDELARQATPGSSFADIAVDPVRLKSFAAQHEVLLKTLMGEADFRQFQQIAADGEILARQIAGATPGTPSFIEQEARVARIMPTVWSRAFGIQRGVIGVEFPVVESASRLTVNFLAGLSSTKARRLVADALINPKTAALLLDPSISDPERVMSLRIFVANMGERETARDLSSNEPPAPETSRFFSEVGTVARDIFNPTTLPQSNLLQRNQERLREQLAPAREFNRRVAERVRTFRGAPQ